MGLAPVSGLAWLKAPATLSALISRFARGLDIDALTDSSVALSALKLRLAMDARLAQLLSLAQLSLLALHNLACFSPEIAHISSLNPLEMF